MADTIAVASGKGGTGKTTIALGLAAVARQPVTLLDCDVEEPNAHLFFQQPWASQRRIAVPVPQVEMTLCDYCGRCRDACRFNALAMLPQGPWLFTELCHACGGCALACPLDAISETPYEIGTLRVAEQDGVTLVDGCLDVGETKSPALIEAVRAQATGSSLTIVDAPPGTSCPMVAAVRNADFVLLVTEPTPLGLNDLRLAAEVVQQLQLACAVVINRSTLGSSALKHYCRNNGLPVLAEIPFDRRIAQAYAGGEPVVSAAPDLADTLSGLLESVLASLAAVRQ